MLITAEENKNYSPDSLFLGNGVKVELNLDKHSLD
jgi:hypothetical protein